MRFSCHAFLLFFSFRLSLFSSSLSHLLQPFCSRDIFVVTTSPELKTAPSQPKTGPCTRSHIARNEACKRGQMTSGRPRVAPSPGIHKSSIRNAGQSRMSSPDPDILHCPHACTVVQPALLHCCAARTSITSRSEQTLYCTKLL